MKKILFVSLALCFLVGMLVNAGCTKAASSANEAIQSAQALPTIKEKTDYLVKQAEAFYNSKEFQQAIQVAQYVLSNLDQNSQPAQSLIEKAKVQLQAAAQKAITDASNKLLGN